MMARYKVQVIDEAGNLVANMTVEATDYADACAQVAQQANTVASAPGLVVQGDGAGLKIPKR